MQIEKKFNKIKQYICVKNSKKQEGEMEAAIEILKEAQIGKSGIDTIKKYYSGEKDTNVEEIKKIIRIEKKNLGSIENKVLSRVIVAVARDLRNILVRMAILLAEKKNDFSAEASNLFEVYIPIAHKINNFAFVSLLEDWKFRIDNPQEYLLIKTLLGEKPKKRKEIVNKAISEIKKKLRKKYVFGRAKHYYSIYQKLLKGYAFEEIKDLYGIRIICTTKKGVYSTLEKLAEKYQVLEIEDYYKKPKKTGYKSIHVITKICGKIFEVQIIEWAEYWENEIGKTAHWIYKNISPDKEGILDEHLSLTRQMIEVFNNYSQKFKFEILGKEIYVFTPKADIIILPSESTALDFAFAVHTEIGMRAKQAVINNQISALNTKLQSGDIVLIKTAKEPTIKRSWLKIAKSSKARQKIRAYLQIKSKEKKKQKKQKIDLQKIKIANCCKPTPEDKVVGYKTTKRKIVIHKADCPNLKYFDSSRLVEIEFPNISKFSVSLNILAKNNPLTLPSLLNIFKKYNAEVKTIKVKIGKNHTEYKIDFVLKKYSFYNYLLNEIKKNEFVEKVEKD